MKSQHLYYLALVGYFGLFFLLMLWHTILAPSVYFPVVMMLMMIVPLLIPLRGVLHAQLKSCAWAAYLSLLYFIHGTTEAFANADHRVLALLEVFFSLLLFFGANFYIRLKKKSPSL